MKAEDLLARLRKRYGAPEWVLLSEVRNAAGLGANRTADAIAMNMWPSRGLAIHGFEIKTSRADWLRELKAPSKAEDTARYCDYWWLVVADADVVESAEIPLGWGVLSASGAGLRTMQEAKEREDVEPVGRSFTAALLRRAQQEIAPDAELRAERAAGYDDGLERGRAGAERAVKATRRDLGTLMEQVTEFEKQIGFRIRGYMAPAGLADDLLVVVNGHFEQRRNDLRALKERAQRIADDIEVP